MGTTTSAVIQSVARALYICICVPHTYNYFDVHVRMQLKTDAVSMKPVVCQNIFRHENVE